MKNKKAKIVDETENNSSLQNLDSSETIKTETKEDKPFDQQIEEARMVLQGIYKKSRRISNIFMIGAVAFLVAGMVLAVQKENNVLPIIGFVLMGVAILSLIIQYIVNRNKFPDATKEYAKNVTALLNGHIFSSTLISDLKTDPLEKIEQSEILSDGVYNSISQLASRNVVTGTYKKRNFRIADLAVYEVGEKRNQRPLAFIGKYLVYPNDLHFEDRIIVSIYNPAVNSVVEKGQTVTKEARLDKPTNIEDLELVMEENNMKIYAKNGVDVKDVLGSKFFKYLSSIQIDKTLLNANLCFWAGRSIAYFSYDDDVVSLPFEKEFNGTPTKEFRKDFEELLEGLSILTK